MSRRNDLLVAGVNHLGTYGRWAFAEPTDVWEFEAEFNKMLDAAAGVTP